MIITQLIKKNNKIIIVFDNGENIKIHYDVFLNNGLRRGDDLTSEVITSLNYQNSLLYAKESALRILGRRMHSIKELKQKLLQKKHTHEVIDNVLNNLCAAGYLDDKEFAKLYIQEKVTRKDGLQKIRNELCKKGISKEIIGELLSGIDNNIQRENALKIAEKKVGQLKGRGIENIKLKQKLYAFLISKGYEYDLIKDILNELLSDNSL